MIPMGFLFVPVRDLGEKHDTGFLQYKFYVSLREEQSCFLTPRFEPVSKDWVFESWIQLQAKFETILVQNSDEFKRYEFLLVLYVL